MKAVPLTPPNDAAPDGVFVRRAAATPVPTAALVVRRSALRLMDTAPPYVFRAARSLDTVGRLVVDVDARGANPLRSSVETEELPHAATGMLGGDDAPYPSSRMPALCLGSAVRGLWFVICDADLVWLISCLVVVVVVVVFVSPLLTPCLCVCMRALTTFLSASSAAATCEFEFGDDDALAVFVFVRDFSFAPAIRPSVDLPCA